jgi:hypothetical protein
MVSSCSGISIENMLLELPEVTFCVTCVLKGQLIEPRYKKNIMSLSSGVYHLNVVF